MLRMYILAFAGNFVFFFLVLWLLPPSLALAALCLLYLALALWQFRTLRSLEQQGVLSTHFFQRFRPSIVLWAGSLLASLVGGGVNLGMLALFAYNAHEPMRWISAWSQTVNFQSSMFLVWGISLIHTQKKNHEKTLQTQK